MRAIFSSILTTQLKAYTFLRTAYNRDPLSAKTLQDVEAMMVAIGKQVAAFWPAVTKPDTVNNLGVQLATRHAQTLGDRAYNAYWVSFLDVIGNNGADLLAHPWSPRPADRSVESGYLTTMCDMTDPYYNGPGPVVDFGGVDSSGQHAPITGQVYDHQTAPCIVDFTKVDISRAETVASGYANQPHTYIRVPTTWIGHSRDNPTDGKEEFIYQRPRNGVRMEIPASLLAFHAQSGVADVHPSWLKDIEAAYASAAHWLGKK